MASRQFAPLKILFANFLAEADVRRELPSEHEAAVSCRGV